MHDHVEPADLDALAAVGGELTDAIDAVYPQFVDRFLTSHPHLHSSHVSMVIGMALAVHGAQLVATAALMHMPADDALKESTTIANEVACMLEHLAVARCQDPVYRTKRPDKGPSLN